MTNGVLDPRSVENALLVASWLSELTDVARTLEDLRQGRVALLRVHLLACIARDLPPKNHVHPLN